MLVTGCFRTQLGVRKDSAVITSTFFLRGELDEREGRKVSSVVVRIKIFHEIKIPSGFCRKVSLSHPGAH